VATRRKNFDLIKTPAGANGAQQPPPVNQGRSMGTVILQKRCQVLAHPWRGFVAAGEISCKRLKHNHEVGPW